MKKIVCAILSLVIVLTINLPGLNVIAMYTTIPTISASSSNHSVLLKSNGEVWAWGNNSSGQLGDGTTTHRYNPVKIDISEVVQVVTGHDHTVVLKNNGEVWAWGNNSMGQLGDGTTESHYKPVRVKISNVKQLAAGYAHTVALKENGEVWAWGWNHHGQLGNGTTCDVQSMPVKSDISDVKQLSAGEEFTIALKNNGEVWGWGSGAFGILGDEKEQLHSTPVKIDILDVKQVSAGAVHAVALKNNGEVWTWGSNFDGQLGNYADYYEYLPVKVDISNVKQVSAGSLSTSVLKNNGEIWSWGWNSCGQLGDGTIKTRYWPVKAKISNVNQIICAGAHTIAIKNNGDICTWGTNAQGRLGDGTTNDQYEPVSIGFNIYSINVHETDINNISNNIETKLNFILKTIPICDTTIYGPTIDILGYDWQPLKFNAKAVLDLAGLSKNITIDEDKKTVHVILGKKNVNGQASVVQTTKMCDASWSKQYNEIKDLYKTMTGFDMKGSSGGVNNWNRFEKMKAQLNHLKCDFIIDADMSILGYLDFDYQSGSLKLSEGGLIETASLGAQIPSGGVLYTALGLKGEEKGTIKATVSSSGKIEPYMSLTPSLTATAKLGVNVGAAFKAEGGVDATLAVLLQTMDPNLKISMSGNLFAYAYIPAFNVTLLDKKYPYLNCELYPEFKNNLSASAYSLRAASVGITEDSLDVQPMDRSYLYAVPLMSVTDENSIYTLNSVYPQNNAQLVRLSGDSMMLVWTGDNGTKSDINRSSLMYSIYKNGIWSEIQTINEDGTATGDFRVATDGTTVYIVYQKMNNVLDDDAEIENSLKAVDLYYAKYQNNEFSAPIRITDNNEVYETIGDINITDSGLEVVWAENSDNNIMFAEGTNYIKSYNETGTIQTIKELTASSESYIDNICIAENGVYYTIVNAVDNTSEIYKDSSSDSYLSSDTALSDVTYFNGKLYYIKNSAIYSYDGNTESKTGIDGISDFKFMSNGNDIAVLTSVFDGKGSELYISNFDNGTWSSKERFTDLGKYIRNYSPFMYSDGTINAAVSVADVNDLNNEDESVYGNTSIMVLNQCDYFDTSTSYLYYEGDIAPNNSIDLYFDVLNDSSSELNSINVKLTDENGNTLDSRTLSCSIAPYATEVLSIPYTLPNEIKLSELNIEISADKAEKDYSNNSASVSYGYANIKVLPVSYKLNSDNTAEINATIKNEGFTDAENVVISVYNGNKNEDILEEKNIGNLSVGDLYELNYTFPEELMVSNEEDSMNAVYVVATTSSDESMYSDNEEKATFDSSICRIDNITIDGTNINVQFTKNFDEEVLLIVASYTDDDRLCSVTYTPVNLSDNKNFTLDTNGASYISAFLWKDLNSLTPKCNKLSKYIE